MAKTKISEFSSTPANNTDIDSINLAEGCAPSGINDAIRELMSQLKDWQSGTSNDPYVVGSSGSLTLNQGTANGVAYLNGSKVVTSGSALTFNGTQFGVGTSSFDGNWTPSLQVVSSASDGTGGIMIESYRPSLIFKDDSASAVRQHIVADGSALIFGSGDASFTEKARIDSSGNLGLGVTPSANNGVRTLIVADQGGTLNALTLGAKTGGYGEIGYGFGFNGSAYKYLISDSASKISFNAGGIQFSNAASGTAGNAITFTQAMTLDASGNLLVGTTSSDGSRLRVYGTYQTLGDGAYEGLIGKASSLVSGGGAGDFAIRSAANLVFSTNGNTERARIDSSGNLLVGTTSTAPRNLTSGSGIRLGSAGQLELAGASGTNYINITDASGTMLEFRRQGPNAVGSITTNGTITVYNTTSDYRLKTIVGGVTGQGARIDALEPIEYTWKSNGSRTRGFLAHKFQEVYADSVTGTKDAVDAEGNPVYQAMQAGSSEVIADLVAEIQSLRKRLADAGIA